MRKPSDQVKNVSVEHTDGRKNSDVQLLNLNDVKFNQLPTIFQNIFPELFGIIAIKTGLKSLEAGDLKNFTRLKYVNFQDNNLLSSLSNDIFSSSIEVLNFHQNDLVYIEPNVFKDLHNLTHVDFGKNSKLNISIRGSHNGYVAITNLIKNLHKIFQDKREIFFAKANNICQPLVQDYEIFQNDRLECMSLLASCENQSRPAINELEEKMSELKFPDEVKAENSDENDSSTEISLSHQQILETTICNANKTTRKNENFFEDFKHFSCENVYILIVAVSVSAFFITDLLFAVCYLSLKLKYFIDT